MSGWTGKILQVDLSERSVTTLSLPDDVYRQYLGGRGLAGYFLQDATDFEWDDPKMPLALCTGPLTGTTTPASGHVIFATRSPLTGAHLDESVGGKLGTQIKAAGFDAVVITGSASSWVGLEIRNSDVRIADATSLLNKDTIEAANALYQFNAHAVIGPAAHSGVRFSSVLVDRYHGAFRGGMGLGFAAKKLKYIGVTGSRSATVSNETLLQGAAEDIRRLTAASSILKGENGIANLGTAALFDLIHTRRMMPTANFRRTFFDAAAKLNAAQISETFEVESFGCSGCHISCRKRQTNATGLPDYEALAHFSALLENDSLRTTVSANALCAQLGMDPISAAVSLACYGEIRGITLNGEQILELLTDIAAGKGEGKMLGQGSLRYATKAGRPECAMTVKGLEIPAFDPRGAFGLALAYVTSTRGACHLRALPLSHEILRKPVATDRFSFSGKARIIKIAEDQIALVDSLTTCPHLMLAASMEEYAQALTAVTGLELTTADLTQVGERIYYSERMRNALWGFDAREDDLPHRFFNEAGTSGPAFDVPPISRNEFLEARQRYYTVRGLDENGMPRQDVAKRLGLKWKN
ncbi:MAG: aldehyde ferredoxin oxidoreductase [Deltaproteobacteria bacterium]|nr:aldehyde ferredoxin oxidoreductase [Deltaproteobacteria bacterium]